MDSVLKHALPTQDPLDLEFEFKRLEPYHKVYNWPMATPHRHAFYQILWFTDKSGAHYVDFERFETDENTIFFIAKDQIHAFDEKCVPHGYLMHFNNSFLRSSYNELDVYLMFDVFNDFSNKPFIRPSQQDLTKFGVLRDMIKEEYSKHSEFGRNLVLSHLLNSFLVLAERIKRADKETDETSGGLACRRLFLQFRKLLEDNYRNNLGVKDYADRLNLTPKRLNEICRLTAGMRTKEVIRERVILEAKRHLIYGEKCVSEVAYEIGFEDPYYFSRVFKKETGLAPTEFKQSRLGPRS